ncbi:Elongation factor 2 [Orbilia javanica]|uniref:Elongation factor 2 n=1 Tax=Orbilia javanica TaxID=47235 RepID=A0AAN8MN22_9PEZI
MASENQTEVQYRESVSNASVMLALSKSENKANRIYISAVPVENELSRAIDNGEITPDMDFKERSRKLADNYGWDVTEARKIWAFGPDDNSNILVDVSKGVENLAEVKEEIIAGFQLAVKEGPISGEPLRGVRFNIVDATLATDSSERSGQLVTATRRAVYAALHLAEPRLLEPFHLATIQVSSDGLAYVHTALSRNGAEVYDEHQPDPSSPYTIDAALPVAQSSVLEADLQNLPRGEASVNFAHSHWEIIPGSPVDPTTKAGKLAAQVRLRNGLAAEIPPVETYHDKL